MRNVTLIVVALAMLALAACGSTPTNQSPGLNPATTGAPAIAAQGAQTIGGDQGQTPQSGTSGTATLNWYFASQQSSGETHARILALAEKMGWTAEQIASALASTNGAPHTVNIQTGDQAISTGPASPVGATTGSGQGQAGGSTNTAARP